MPVVGRPIHNTQRSHTFRRAEHTTLALEGHQFRLQTRQDEQHYEEMKVVALETGVVCEFDPGQSWLDAKLECSIVENTTRSAAIPVLSDAHSLLVIVVVWMQHSIQSLLSD